MKFKTNRDKNTFMNVVNLGNIQSFLNQGLKKKKSDFFTQNKKEDRKSFLPMG